MERNNESLALISDKDIQELNDVRTKLEQTLMTKLRNAGIYFHSMSRVKTLTSLQRKLDTGKYGTGKDDKKIQDLIGIRINLFYTEDIRISEALLEDTFMVDNWSKTAWEENRFEAQKCNGVFKIPSKYLINISDQLWEQPFDRTFEVQLRTVLFEGWHEIEHEMRYKYKLDEGFDDNRSSLWDGQEKDARMMNSIIANLELCDWSIVQIFDNLARDQYIKKNWENAIRSKYRLKITQDKIKPEVRAYFDEHPEVVEKFWAVSKQQLVNILLNKKYQKVLSPNRVIYLINKEVVNDEFISAQLDREQFGRVLNKEIKQEIRPLVSDLVFDLSSLTENDTLPSISSGNLKKVEVTQNGETTTYKKKKQRSELAGGWGTISLTQCADYNVKNLAKYGLDEANRITVTATYKDSTSGDKKTCTVYIGNENEDNRYVQLKDSNMVYEVGSSIVENMMSVDK